jgi:hypothetical protein
MSGKYAIFSLREDKRLLLSGYSQDTQTCGKKYSRTPKYLPEYLVVDIPPCFKRVGSNCEYEDSKVGSANLQT